MVELILNEDELCDIADAFRLAILDAKRRFLSRDRMINFPWGCCDDASDLFAHYLQEKYNMYTQQGNGIYRDDIPDNDTNHAWLILDKEILIDLTATQFMFCGAFDKDIYVGKSFWFYEGLERVQVGENFDITQDERLWRDYQIIMEYLPNRLNWK